MGLLNVYCQHANFFAPDTAFAEAGEHLPAILARRGVHPAETLEMLDSLRGVVQTVEPETYLRFEGIARRRLKSRDEEDWPVLAAALALQAPIWTSDRIELYMKACLQAAHG